MSVNPPRIRREKKTIQAMLKIYCNSFHGTHKELCRDCAELLDYARLRLDKCPFQENKTTCANCPVHCYKPSMREKVKSVMKYSGPRMLLKHPVLALFHLVDEIKEK